MEEEKLKNEIYEKVYEINQLLEWIVQCRKSLESSTEIYPDEHYFKESDFDFIKDFNRF